MKVNFLKKINYRRLVISLFIPQVAALIGSLFLFSEFDRWYDTLQRPAFSPPGWLFAPVWTILYLLMGVSLYLLWQKGKGKEGKIARILFLLHLPFNAFWPLLFFLWQNPCLALFDLVMLWLFLIILIFRFKEIDRLAAYLLAPYFLWVSFAVVLNYFILSLNY